jgi:ribosomal protein S20
MSAKRSKAPLPASSRQIRQAKKALKTTSQQARIDLMVRAGVMTKQQADTAKSKLPSIDS